jgi:hypothetical protein
MSGGHGLYNAEFPAGQLVYSERRHLQIQHVGQPGAL